jgi:hypothetical protein
MGLAAGRLLRNVYGSLGVTAIVATMAFGLPALDRAVAADRPVSHDAPYRLGGGITVVPPPAAVLDVTRTRPHPDRGTALFRLGPVQYALIVTPSTGDLAGAVERLRGRLCGTGHCQTGDAAELRLDGGPTGRVGAIVAPAPRAGRYAVFVVADRVVEVVVTGPDDAVAARLPAVHDSLATLRQAR